MAALRGYALSSHSHTIIHNHNQMDNMVVDMKRNKDRGRRNINVRTSTVSSLIHGAEIGSLILKNLILEYNNNSNNTNDNDNMKNQIIDEFILKLAIILNKYVCFFISIFIINI